MTTPIRDLNKHRICDISEDNKVISIVRGNCITYITANSDGTLNVVSKPLAA